MAKLDQRRFDNQRGSRQLLDGAAAAALLGVKRQTLYAYASRGLVRSEPIPGRRERRYERADLERLKARHDARSGHGPVAAGALRFGEPVLTSAITLIENGQCFYRGRPVVELMRRAHFEAVADLLFGGAPGPWPAPAERVLDRARRLLPKPEHPYTVMPIVVALLAQDDAERFVISDDLDRARARRLLVTLAASVSLTTGGTPRGKSVAELFAGAYRSRARKLVESALVAMADHELNVSTFAVRVAASAGADVYAAVQAGLATLSGPRHGRVTERVLALVEDAGTPQGARTLVRQRLERGESLPGFGHLLYPRGDPRGRALLELAARHRPRRQKLDVLLTLLREVERLTGAIPNSDSGLAAVALAAGLEPHGAAALFAVGRAAGWMAHAFEQRQDGFLVRPRARYVGLKGYGEHSQR